MPRPIPVEAPSASEDHFGRKVLLGGLGVLLLLLQVRLWIGEGSLAEVAALEEARDVRVAENRRLAEHNRILESEVRTLKADPASLESRARTELGMIREGETFFMVLPERTGQAD